MFVNGRDYIKASVIVIIYYVIYNTLGYFLPRIGDAYFGIKDLSIINIIICSVLLTATIVVLKKRQVKGFSLNTSIYLSFKIVLFTIFIAILLKIFKDPILSYYEIIGKNISEVTVEKNIFFLSDYWVYLVYSILLIPVLEEIFFRLGILPYLMRHSKAIFYPILFSSILFALIHINYHAPSFSDLLSFFNAFIFGVLASVLYVQTRNILYPILLHVFVNIFGFLSDVVYVYEYFELLKTLNFELLYWSLVLFSGVGIILLLKVIGNSSGSVSN